MYNLSLKHKLNIVCNDITLLDIMKAYNKTYDKSIKNPSFYKMINDETVKYKILQDMLDSIGYDIVFRRKRDGDQ